MEKDFAQKVVQKLLQWFDIKPEVWSRCGRYRIDYILSHKKRFNTHFGIEFKDFDHKRGEELGNHILQSMRYSRSEFEVADGIFRRVPVLLCPPISYTYLMCPVPENKKIEREVEYFHDRHPKNASHHSVNGMLGALGVGEVRTMTYWNKQFIYFSFSNHMIWSSIPKWNPRWDKGKDHSEIQDVHEKYYPELMKKINLFA